MVARQRQLLAAAAVAAGVALAGCGGGPAVVASVGDTPIAKARVEHWMALFSAEQARPDRSRAALMARALDYLITAQWLIGEAAEVGSGVTARELDQQVQERVSAYPNGAREFREQLALTGRTEADARFEVEVELALAKVRQAAARHRPQVTPADISAYYKQNLGRFSNTEERKVETVYTHSAASAQALERRIEGRRRLAGYPKHETLTYTKGLKGGSDNAVSKAIFTTNKLDTIEGPVRVGVNYFLFEVVELHPPVQTPIAAVAGTIAQELETQARRLALAAFIRAWRAKWVARTDCRPGWVVQKCRQYVQAKHSSPENPLAFE